MTSDIDEMVKKINEKLNSKVDTIVAQFIEHITAQINELDLKTLARIDSIGEVWCLIYINNESCEFGAVNEMYDPNCSIFPFGRFINGEYSKPEEAIVKMDIEPYIIKVAKGLHRAGIDLIEVYISLNRGSYILKTGVKFIPSELFNKVLDKSSDEASDDFFDE